MRSNQPPPIANWLLRHFGSSPNNDSVIGDLNEQYRQGRSRSWYWREALVAILFSGGQSMLRLVGTSSVVALFITMLMLMARDGAFRPPDPISALGLIGTIDCLILITLLALRAIWRSSVNALRRLYWPTFITTMILGFCGTTTMWQGATDFYLQPVGAYVDVMCLLAAFSLWRTRRPVEKV